MSDLKSPDEKYNPHMYWVEQIHFLNPEGTRLISRSGDSVRYWDVDTAVHYGIGVQVSHVEQVNEQIYGFVANNGPAGDAIAIDIRDMVFSPTAPLLIFGDRNGHLHLWDYSDQEHIQEQVILLGEDRFTNGSWLFIPMGNCWQSWDVNGSNFGICRRSRSLIMCQWR